MQVWDDAVWPAAGVGSYEVENIMSSGQGKLPLEVVTDNNLLRQRYEDAELGGKLPLYVTTTSAQGVEELTAPDGSPFVFVPQLTTGPVASNALWNSAIKLAPLPIVQIPTRVNSVRGSCAVDDTAAAMMINLYDADLNRIAWTGWQAVPGVGQFRFAHHSVVLYPGRQYFYGVMCDSGTATFGETAGFGGFTTAYAAPLPNSITTTTTLATTFPALTAEYVTVTAPTGFADVSRTDGRYRTLGKNPANSQPWGVDITTTKIVYSDTSGASWYQMMSAPMLPRGMIDLIYTGTQLVVLCNDCSIWISSDLTAAATWTEITIPVSAGWRRGVAITRPYGIEVMDGYVVWGEYSAGDTLRNHPTDPAGPRLFKYKISTSGPWELARTFANARHIHSLYTQGVGLMMVTLGDGTDAITGEQLADVGVWRCTDIVANTFSQRQNLSFDRRYPVDLTYKAGVGLMCASDAPGVYVQSMLRHTSAGHKVLAQQVLIDRFRDLNGDYYDDATAIRGGNSRSIVIDNKNNVWCFSAEEAESWLIGVPPPYTHYVKCAKLPVAAHYRAVVSGTRLLMWDRMYELGKFAGQK